MVNDDRVLLVLLQERQRERLEAAERRRALRLARTGTAPKPPRTGLLAWLHALSRP